MNVVNRSGRPSRPTHRRTPLRALPRALRRCGGTGTCRTGQPGENRRTEGTMGYVAFMIIAFVMLGVERLGSLLRSGTAHGEDPTV